MNLKILALACALLMPPAVFGGEAGTLDLPDLQSLQHQATDSVNISLDPWLLGSLSAFMDDKDADSAAMKKMLSGIKSIQIRSFAFGTDFVYPTSAIDGIRQQLSAPGWSKMVQVHNRKDHEDIDIYLMMDQHRANGFALIASDPRQLTLINIVGSINMDDLPMLERHFHIPAVGIPTANL
jgi:hypothetical protein